MREATIDAVISISNAFTLHNLSQRLGKVEAIPDDIEQGLKIHNNCLDTFMEYNSDFNWRKERDCFIKCSTSLANRTKEKFKGVDLTHLAFAEGMTKIIDGEALPEVL